MVSGSSVGSHVTACVFLTDTKAKVKVDHVLGKGL